MADVNTPEGTPCQVHVEDENGMPVIRLAGELDMSSTQAVRPVLDGVLVRSPQRVVFHTSDLEYMDSSGIALLLTTAQQVPEVELRAPSPIVRRLIELSGLQETLRITP